MPASLVTFLLGFGLGVLTLAVAEYLAATQWLGLKR